MTLEKKDALTDDKEAAGKLSMNHFLKQHSEICQLQIEAPLSTKKMPAKYDGHFLKTQPTKSLLNYVFFKPVAIRLSDDDILCRIRF